MRSICTRPSGVDKSMELGSRKVCDCFESFLRSRNSVKQEENVMQVIAKESSSRERK